MNKITKQCIKLSIATIGVILMVLAINGCGVTAKGTGTGGSGVGSSVTPIYHNPSFNYTDDGASLTFTVTKNYISTMPEYRKPYIKEIKYTGFSMVYVPTMPKISEYITVTWTDPNPGTFILKTIDTVITVNAAGIDNEYYISYGNGDSGSFYYTIMPMRAGLPAADSHLSQLEKVSGNYVELYQNSVLIERINMWQM